MDIVLSLALQVLTLVGVSAAIAAVINILKTFGLVKDGTAGGWSAALNLLALIALVTFKVLNPAVDFQQLNVQFDAFAKIALLVLSFIVQIKSSVEAHYVLSSADLPVIGKSFANDEFKKEIAKAG